MSDIYSAHIYLSYWLDFILFISDIFAYFCIIENIKLIPPIYDISSIPVVKSPYRLCLLHPPISDHLLVIIHQIPFKFIQILITLDLKKSSAQVRFIHYNLNTLSLDSLHDTLDWGVTEIIWICFHCQAIYSNYLWPSFYNHICYMIFSGSVSFYNSSN